MDVKPSAEKVGVTGFSSMIFQYGYITVFLVLLFFVDAIVVVPLRIDFPK
jgi:hypothetical protein